MFDRNTVIVLGAGASSPFGFPLGSELHRRITMEIQDLRRRLSGQGRYARLPLGKANVEEFLGSPLFALVTYLESPFSEKLLPERIRGNDMRRALFNLGADLEEQTSDTIDRFIRDNPSHAFIGKLLLGQKILLKMYDRDGHQLKLRTFSERMVGKGSDRRNWYQQLANLIREGANDAVDLSNNRLVVVTFNYDLSLEIALDRLLGATERHRGALVEDAIRVLHVNGAPSLLPPVVTDVGEFVLQESKTLSLVDDKVGVELDEVRAKAKSALCNAERIYVIGFHMDRSNTAAIGLRNVPDKRRIHCLNFSGHGGVQQRILELGIPIENVVSGTSQDPLHIEHAIDEGFLER